jgi:hypothetical protein
MGNLDFHDIHYPFRLYSKASTRTSASSMNTHCHQTQRTTKLITGNYQTLRLAQRHAGVEFNSEPPFATNDMRVSSKMNSAGQMLKIKNPRRFREHAISSLVLLIGGLAPGNRVP